MPRREQILRKPTPTPMDRNKNIKSELPDAIEIIFTDPEGPVFPPDLDRYSDIVEKVARFKDNDYPEGIFEDNVKKHIVRLIKRISLLDWGKIENFLNRNRLERIIWIHDIPEAGDLLAGEKDQTADITAVAKDADTTLAQKIEQKERDTAREIFSDDDFRLFTSMERTGNFLKAGEDIAVDPEATVAYLLDRIDGNTFFHFSLARWTDSDNFNPGLNVHADSTIHTMKQADRFLGNLKKIEDKFPQLSAFCAGLIEEQLEFVKRVWNDVKHKDRIPELIKNWLAQN